MVKGTVSHKTLSSAFSRNTNHRLHYLVHCTGVTNSGTGYVAQGSKISRCLGTVRWLLIIIITVQKLLELSKTVGRSVVVRNSLKLNQQPNTVPPRLLVQVWGAAFSQIYFLFTFSEYLCSQNNQDIGFLLPNKVVLQNIQGLTRPICLINTFRIQSKRSIKVGSQNRFWVALVWQFFKLIFRW